MTRSDSPRLSRFSPLRAQRLIEFMALELAPAIAISAVVITHNGLSSEAAFAFLATLIAAHALGSSAYAPHLLPLARVGLRAGAPLIGGIAAAGGAVLDGYPPTNAGIAIGVLSAWVVLALGFWVQRKFVTDRPVRVAVLSAGLAAALASELRTAGITSYRVVGWVSADAQAFAAEQLESGGQYLGSLDGVRDIVQEHRIDLVVSCPVHGDEHSRLRTLEILSETCLDLPVRMLELSQLYESLLGHVPLGTADAAWFQYMLNPSYQPGSATVKRAMDLAIGSIVLVATFPLMALSALAIKLSGGGSVLFRQRRVGQGGRTFTMLKLRSMDPVAESEGEARWSSKDDDRVTRVGHLLRRTHIDELPQVWNIIRGEMTVVGPRPEQPALVEQLEAQNRYYQCRHLLKPGVTGWAQVRCGYAGTRVGSSWKLCHDLFYLKHRSALCDLLIIVETLRMVFAGAQFGLRAPDEHFLADPVDVADTVGVHLAA